MSAKKRAASNSATKTRVPLAKAQSSFASALDEIDSEEDERRRQSCTTLPRKLTFGQCESQVGKPYQSHQGRRNYYPLYVNFHIDMYLGGPQVGQKWAMGGLFIYCELLL